MTGPTSKTSSTSSSTAPAPTTGTKTEFDKAAKDVKEGEVGASSSQKQPGTSTKKHKTKPTHQAHNIQDSYDQGSRIFAFLGSMLGENYDQDGNGMVSNLEYAESCYQGGEYNIKSNSGNILDSMDRFNKLSEYQKAAFFARSIGS